MKKILIFTLSVLTVLSCSGAFDDSKIQEQLKDHESRLEKLEEICKDLNADITSLKGLVQSMEEKDYVTGVTPVMEGDKVIGHTITFAKNDPITIYNGTPGQDGNTPQIGIKKDEKGIYCWTLDGDWLLDAEGNRLPAEGTDGKPGTDGLTPELKIENGYWYVRYGQGEWQQLGAAVGDGNIVADSIFKEVKIGTDDVTFVLNTGEDIVLPLKNIRLSVHFADHAIGIRAGETVEVAYTVEGASEGTLVKAVAQNGWKVKVNATHFDKGTLTVTAPDPLVEDEIIVFVYDGKQCTIMSAVDFVKATVTSSVREVELEAAAGTFSVTVESNLGYTVEIPEADRGWLEQVLTKSMKTEELRFAYQENKTSAARKSAVTLKDRNGADLLVIPVSQKAAGQVPEPPVPGKDTWTRIRYDYDLNAGDIVSLACSSKGKALGGLHTGKTYFDPVDVTCKGEQMSGTGMTEFTVGGTKNAWTFTATEGALQAQGEKNLVFGQTATAWRITIDTEGTADINCNYGDIMYNASSPRFTVYNTAASAQMLHVEIYKKNWTPSTGDGRHPEVNFGELTASGVTSGAATFSQTFSNASSIPVKVGFQYTTNQEAFKSGAELDYIEAPQATATEGTFSVSVHSLAPDATYYVRSYVKLYGSGEFATENKTFNSRIISFKTSPGGNPDPTPGPAGKGPNTHGHLVNFEIPHADVNIPDGQQFNSTVNERHGGTKAYIYNTQDTGQRIVTHTFMNNSKVYRNYTFLYDYEKKLPLWLSYHMNRGYCGTGGDRTNAWGYDPAVPEEHQPNLKSSYGSGYNRGHMLASHARSAIVPANQQAFYYTNMTPQDERNLNAGGCSWNELEDHEMSIIPSGRDTLYVVTGCTFDEPVKWITSKGGDRCAVPKECYKCFMMCSFGADGKMISAKGIGYLMPNNADGRKHYSTFAKTIDEIESLTGFDLFANVPKELQEKAESVKTEL